MKQFRLLMLCAVALVGLSVTAQTPNKYVVSFYNFENLFDTINDPDTYDEEFTPKGPKAWNSYKYYKKLGNLEQVIFDIARYNGTYPAVLGVCEVENRNVLEDFVAMPKLAPAGYRIVHYDSPDARGVDVAFFYRPDVFELEGSKAHKLIVPELPNFRTRDILTMWGKIEGEPFFMAVCHWSSRLGGQAASAFKRNAAGAQMRQIADSVLAANPATKIIFMGDLNDDPTDPSVREYLGARENKNKLVAGDLYSPFIEMFKKGEGTLAYQDAWNLFDNMIVSENLANGTTGALRLTKAEKGKYYGNIFRASYLFQKEGQYKGYPLRTFVSNNFQSGYSDHMPVYLLITK
ncbi:MAG: endonuclease/exonuclease/phosphatase family protein [Rikenellaceae bacterium]|nr:endonuclease/exonuclease/phosphatase family protein [Rikenellaceae bacterium]